MPYELARLQQDIAQIQHEDAGFGSARLVAENLLLTAAHLLWNKTTGAGPFLHEWQVRLERDRSESPWLFRRGNRVVWHDPLQDLALIEIPLPQEGPLRPEVQLRVATVSGNNPHTVEARGYPRASKENGPRKLVLASGDLDAVREDEPLRLGVKESDLPNNPHEGWPGMSGSVVLLRDGPDPNTIWVFGVVKEVPVNYDGQLRVARLATAWPKASSLRRLLVAAGAPDEDAKDPTYEVESIRGLIERVTEKLSLSNAEKTALAADLAKVREELNGTNELIGGFLETMIGRHVSPEQYAPTLFRIVADWKIAAQRIDALSYSQNLSPQLAGMKEAAATAHKAGRLDHAIAAVAEIDRIESESLAQLVQHEREVRDEVHLRRRGNAETKAAQAALARTSLAYREAAEYYVAAARVVAEADLRAEWRYRLSAADSLVDLGVEFGDNQSLLEAMSAYREEVLPRAPRDQAPLDWAETQNRLGTALWRLGELEAGTDRLKDAMRVFRLALKERTRDRVPLDWAETQTRLGTVLWRLGEREGRTTRLKEAAATFRASLKERTRDRAPLDWAETQTNLGSVFKTLGELEQRTEPLEEAVTAFRAALEERTRDRAPLLWAITQNNLGSTLATIGRSEPGTTRLEEAAAAFRAALEAWTRNRVPVLWAMAQYGLGTTLRMLGERESGTARLKQAVIALRSGLHESRRDRVPLQWAATQSSLGHALWRLGEREKGTRRLKEAVVAYHAALAVYTRDREPFHWALTHNNLGNALQTLGERENGTARLAEALVAFRSALEVRTRGRSTSQWAMSQSNLGNTLRALAEREKGTARLEEAVAAWEASLSAAAPEWTQHWVLSLPLRIEEARAEIVRRTLR